MCYVLPTFVHGDGEIGSFCCQTQSVGSGNGETGVGTAGGGMAGCMLLLGA